MIRVIRSVKKSEKFQLFLNPFRVGYPGRFIALQYVSSIRYFSYSVELTYLVALFKIFECGMMTKY